MLPSPQHPEVNKLTCPKGLPWAPKVRERDIEMFLKPNCSRLIGYTLGSDRNIVVGPKPIDKSIKTLKQHKSSTYRLIAEVQAQTEEEYLAPPGWGEEGRVGRGS